MGGTPLQLIPFFSFYSISYSLGNVGDNVATYVEEDSTVLAVEVSTDNGSNWDVVTYQTAFNSSVAGTNLLWRFTNTTSRDIYVGYYAVLWRV